MTAPKNVNAVRRVVVPKVANAGQRGVQRVAVQRVAGRKVHASADQMAAKAAKAAGRGGVTLKVGVDLVQVLADEASAVRAALASVRLSDGAHRAQEALVAALVGRHGATSTSVLPTWSARLTRCCEKFAPCAKTAPRRRAIGSPVRTARVPADREAPVDLVDLWVLGGLADQASAADPDAVMIAVRAKVVPVLADPASDAGLTRGRAANRGKALAMAT
jgi:hypothetical protein